MATQRYSSENVLSAARRRITMVFDHFETIHVSISGGKDSTVLAHLALIEARKRGRKVGLFFLDEEVVYQSTIDQVEYLMALYPENTNRLWLQIPFTLTNATSLTETHLDCWEPGKHKLWMRSKSKDNICAKPWDKTKEKLRPGYKRLDFYGAVENFERCYTGAAFLVGLRGTESPNRWRAMVKNPVEIGGRPIYWATPKGSNVTLYPMRGGATATKENTQFDCNKYEFAALCIRERKHPSYRGEPPMWTALAAGVLCFVIVALWAYMLREDERFEALLMQIEEEKECKTQKFRARSEK